MKLEDELIKYDKLKFQNTEEMRDRNIPVKVVCANVSPCIILLHNLYSGIYG